MEKLGDIYDDKRENIWKTGADVDESEGIFWEDGYTAQYNKWVEEEKDESIVWKDNADLWGT